jgi:hypothetical protein
MKICSTNGAPVGDSRLEVRRLSITAAETISGPPPTEGVR